VGGFSENMVSKNVTIFDPQKNTYTDGVPLPRALALVTAVPVTLVQEISPRSVPELSIENRYLNNLTPKQSNIASKNISTIVVVGQDFFESKPSSVETYDSKGKYWQEDSVRCRKYASAVTSYNTSLFVTGGLRPGIVEGAALNDVEYANVTYGMWDWKTGPPMSVARLYHAAITVNDSLIVCGGLNQFTNATLNTCEKLQLNPQDGSPLDTKWTPIAPMIHERVEFYLVLVNDTQLLAVGGFSVSKGGFYVIKRIEKYTPGPTPSDPGKWDVLSDKEIPRDFIGAGMVVLDMPSSSMKC